MKPQVFFAIIIILLAANTLQASARVDEITDDIRDKAISKFVETLLSQKCWDGDWNIANETGKPVKSVKKDEHIRSWIDIVGFKEEVIINRTHYVNGSAKDFAIVETKAWHVPINGRVVSFRTVHSISDNDGNTTATQTTTFHWKKWMCGKDGFHWNSYREELQVSVTVPSPEKFTRRLQNVTTKVQVHNRSVNPVTYIFIPSMDNLTLVRATYNGSRITRHDQLGRVIKNDKGTELVEFTRDTLSTWIKDKNQSVIDHRGREITIFGDDFNLSLLDVVLVSPYETRTVTDYEIIEVNDHIKVPVSLLKVVAFGVIGAALIYLTLGVLIRAL